MKSDERRAMTRSRGRDFLRLYGPALLFLCTIGGALSYEPLNQSTDHPHLVRTWVDMHIPFEPLFAVPYLLFLPIFWLVVVWALLRRVQFVQLALTLLLVFLVSDLVYLTFQTHVPRPTQVGHGLGPSLVRFIYSNDKPYNGLPSEHASMATIMALFLFVIRSKWRYVAVAFSLLVIASTFFVKQHFVLDAVAGIALAIAAFAVMFRLGPQLVAHRKPSSSLDVTRSR